MILINIEGNNVYEIEQLLNWLYDFFHDNNYSYCFADGYIEPEIKEMVFKNIHFEIGSNIPSLILKTIYFNELQRYYVQLKESIILSFMNVFEGLKSEYNSNFDFNNLFECIVVPIIFININDNYSIKQLNNNHYSNTIFNCIDEELKKRRGNNTTW